MIRGLLFGHAHFCLNNDPLVMLRLLRFVVIYVFKLVFKDVVWICLSNVKAC